MATASTESGMGARGSTFGSPGSAGCKTWQGLREGIGWCSPGWGYASAPNRSALSANGHILVKELR